MLYAYVFAAVVGVVLLVASLVGGSDDHDGDGATDVTAHVGADGGLHNDASPGGALSGAASVLLSLRAWTYVLALFGVAGLLLRYAAGAREPAAALVALATAVVGTAASRALFQRASGASGTSGVVRASALVGRSAAVVVPFQKGATGKVRVVVDGHPVEILATTDDPTLDRRDEVLIVELRDGGATAHVTRNPAVEYPARREGPTRP